MAQLNCIYMYMYIEPLGVSISVVALVRRGLISKDRPSKDINLYNNVRSKHLHHIRLSSCMIRPIIPYHTGCGLKCGREVYPYHC